MSKNIFVRFGVFALFVAIANISGAVTIYDNGTYSGNNAVSSLGPNGWQGDDFMLAPTGTTITTINWAGTALDPAAFPDDFTIIIYESDAGLPAASPLHVLNVGAGDSKTATGNFVTPFLEVYTYSATVAPITLTANTQYFISIHNIIPDPFDIWYWATSEEGTGNGITTSSGGSLWVPSGSMPEYAFSLEGPATSAPIPEPATLSLLGMGLAGLALRTRRRKRSA